MSLEDWSNGLSANAKLVLIGGAMKRRSVLVFLACVTTCLNLIASAVDRGEDNGLNFDNGCLTLERDSIYLFDPIALPEIEWSAVECYETNDKEVAKTYATANRQRIQDEAIINAVSVDKLGECKLGQWVADEEGRFSFHSVVSYAPELWEVDMKNVRALQLMWYSQTFTWHPKFSNYNHFLTGISGFKFARDKEKIQILCRVIDFNDDKKFANGCFYIATQWVIVNDLRIKDKIKKKTAWNGWLDDVNEIKTQAEEDNEVQQWTLGNMHWYGVGVEKSPALAMKWYQRSAEGGFLKACYKVKDFTASRLREVERLNAKALLTRAEQGDVEAQCAMGIAYVRGEGVEHSYQQAAHWFLLAAQKGNMDAQYYLGNAYTKGEGVKQSDEKAFEWFLAAALQGHPDAQTRVFNAYTTGQGVVQSTEKARAWLLRLVEQDNAMAQLYLALEYYHQGQHEKARAWFKRAEDNGIMLEGIYERLKTNGNRAKSQQ